MGWEVAVQVKAVVQVAPLQSMLFPIPVTISAVTVCDVPKAKSKNTSSCGRGVRVVQFVAPPDHSPPAPPALIQC